MKAKLLLFAIFAANLTACTPKIQLETPKEGITINMNVVVDHKIEVSMDEKSRTMIKTVDMDKEK
ncbi:YnbE family lipoprotein [Frederiksenia canicola]|uniref:YnbE family lipoprotein n=1 Tax=Frederiksenia canicola TaxID=123824 RepID=A0AAE7C2S9_9PAST|nr:YnbE family lipoprotein [Frederiksenia canicola]QIM64998.1 YnbE family lipoprotein [Frederiksenia canicola]RPE96593.1 YnbE-like lipoprotein [Frederiksenia canicola]